MKILVIDYRMGNLGSVRRSFEECGADVVCSQDPAELRSASRIVLPGVGSFRDGMSHLTEMGWIPEIRKAVREEGVPLLGICLGMQLLSSTGCEGGDTDGLNLIPGTVKRLVPDTPQARIPHVGWNEVIIERQHPIFSGIPNRSDFYFVHSYHFVPNTGEHVAATTPYCGGFASAVAAGSVYGTQFHPEKSSKAGFRFIRNFLSI